MAGVNVQRETLLGLTDEEWLAVRQAAIQWAEQVKHGQPGPEPLLSAVTKIRTNALRANPSEGQSAAWEDGYEQGKVDRAAEIRAQIESLRNEHWQEHLTKHPFADAKSCPRDYGMHDAYYAAAKVASGTG